jgi:tRNA(His) guanylyltransferase
MANSEFAYVRSFEASTSNTLLPQTYLVLRIDGKHFTKFTSSHSFVKPNDQRGLDLMNECATKVMERVENELGGARGKNKQKDRGVIVAFGESDEYR